MGENIQFPFSGLGSRLRRCRELLHESMAEVSGAVEIDMETLSKIEQGISRPSEEVLLLLVSHLGISEDEAIGLWQLAGYDKNQDTTEMDQLTKQMLMVLPFDNRAIYADDSAVASNKNGMTISFLQSVGNDPVTVSRIGISREHAQNLIRLLQQSLLQNEVSTKLLPLPRVKTDKQAK